MENINRKKMLNAILYFAKNTKHANTTKIFKLLNIFDFEHFRQTGYPAIGLEYKTFKLGPVPEKLWFQIKKGTVPEDFKVNLGITILKKENILGDDIVEYKFIAKKKPDLSVFSPREKRILENIIFIYKDSTAGEMSRLSHSHNQPWAITKEREGMNKTINYMTALQCGETRIDSEHAKESLEEYFEIIKNFNLEPV